MMTLEVNINGVIISVIKLTNTGMEIKGDTVYAIEAYLPDEEFKPGKLVETSVKHSREEGALTLVLKALNEVNAKLK